MRRSLCVSAFAVVATACSDPLTQPTTLRPSRPDRELVEPADRVHLGDINSHTYGSFAIRSPSSGVILSGPANFPGHPPAGPGTCRDGLWLNPQGKPTTGSLETPHPHCLAPESTTEVVLEPISSCFTGFPSTGCQLPYLVGKGEVHTDLQLSGLIDRTALLRVHGITHFSGELADWALTAGEGVVVGYAIEVGSGRRVGYLSFDLSQYGSRDVNYFDATCAIDETLAAPCLNLVLRASYKPFPPEDGGIGESGEALGFLWFTPAKEPYNYGI